MGVGCQDISAQIPPVNQTIGEVRGEIDWHMEFGTLYTLIEEIPWSWKR